MRIALRGSFSSVFSGLAAILCACSLVHASPITQNAPNQGTTASGARLAPSSVQTDGTGIQTTRIKPTDLTTSAPVKSQKNKKTGSKPGPIKSENLGSTSRDIPEIPWEMIEQALKRQNLPSAAHQEPKVVIGGDYQQLIINALPDFGLEVANLPDPRSIPILDFVKTQSDALSANIAVYTSDLTQPDHNIEMASNGNLDSDHAPAEPGVLGTTEDRPLKLKNLFFWGLGLLLLYTLLDAIFAKLRRQDTSQSRDADSGDDRKARRPRRRRSFSRSRARHKHT